ncbi:DUF1775 domain-containing protein [Nocardioides humi]|uniref:YncI copper-binding domain-containing protein n=1 Tax=Nocardioides humi TaxID=449461 RepID=A0ABN2C0R6_9ACTN|nr:DUF1775 domain-containing protein [Nocardioides humi]
MRLAALLVLLQLAAPAAAVEIASVVPRGDGSADLVLSLSGGCGDAGTTALSATMPTGAAVVAVGDPRRWSHRVVDGRVEWEGPGIAAAEPARFTVTVRLDAEPGDTVLVPAEQTCADGTRVDWADEAEGDEHPAPRFTATAATVDPSARPLPATAQPGGAGPLALALAVVLLPGLAVLAVVRRSRRARGTLDP